MTDDNQDDVQPKALIQYCPICDDMYLGDLPHQCTVIVGKPVIPAMNDEASKDVWNAAIEAAAKWLETADRNDTNDANEIRKLKK